MRHDHSSFTVSRIYLDNNATTELRPEVLDAMMPFLHGTSANASSIHREGRNARRAVESARESLAQSIDAAPQQIVFTSGGTEANNQAIFGLAGQAPARIVTTTIEHPSVQACFDRLAARSCQVERLPVDQTGIVSNEAVLSALERQPRLVSIMLANNETGAIQEVAEFAAAARKSNAFFHTDAVQAPGRLSLSFRKLGVSSMSLSAHKFHGPSGVGALVVESKSHFEPLLLGGHQEFGLRAGTEPVAQIVGMARALELAVQELETNAKRMCYLRDLLTEGLTRGAQPVVINGPEHRLPNTVNVQFLGVDAQATVVSLDLEGVACSTGSACSSGAPTPSLTLIAMGRSKEQARSSIRFSISRLTTEDEITQAVQIITSVVRRQRSRSEA